MAGGIRRGQVVTGYSWAELLIVLAEFSPSLFLSFFLSFFLSPVLSRADSRGATHRLSVVCLAVTTCVAQEATISPRAEESLNSQ